jgi:hypothetical protein
MGQLRIASILVASFVALIPAAQHHAAVQHAAQYRAAQQHARLPGPGPSGTSSPSPTSSLTPAVSFVPDNPILIQQSSSVWTTTVVVDSFPTCLGNLKYQLVTIAPNEVVPGQLDHAPDRVPDYVAGRPKASKGTCLQPTEQGSQISLRFTVAFKTVPLGATLVLRQRNGVQMLPAITLTVRRQVTRTQYLWIPIGCGLALAIVFFAIVFIADAYPRKAGTRPGGAGTGNGTDDRQHEVGAAPGPGIWSQFLHRPVLATAAWTFKDSWATNITLAGTAVAAILTAGGAVSTLFPGVQLDRFAILIAICGAIIAIAPLVFSICNASPLASLHGFPDDAMAGLPEQQPGTGDGGSATKPKFPAIQVTAGASVTLAAGTHVRWSAGEETRKAATTIQIPPSRRGCRICIKQGWLALPGDSTIVVTGQSRIRICGDFSLPAENASGKDGAPPASLVQEPPKRVLGEADITVGSDGATVKVVGVGEITLPPGVQIEGPGGKTPPLSREERFRVPLAGNMIKADMWSMMTAAAVTMFGVGAQFGVLIVLAWLSHESSLIRWCAIALALVGVLIVLGYGWFTTRELADSKPGSALSVSDTSFIY